MHIAAATRASHRHDAPPPGPAHTGRRNPRRWTTPMPRPVPALMHAHLNTQLGGSGIAEALWRAGPAARHRRDRRAGRRPARSVLHPRDGTVGTPTYGPATLRGTLAALRPRCSPPGGRRRHARMDHRRPGARPAVAAHTRALRRELRASTLTRSPVRLAAKVTQR